MAKMASSAQFKTPTCRLSYVQNMITRVTKKDDAGNVIMRNDKPVTEQQCTLIFDNSTDRSAFDAALKEAIIAQWGEAGMERAKNGLIKLPYLKGDGPEARNKKTGELHPGMGADKWFIRVATQLDAPVRFRSQSIPVTLGTGDDQIKSGDYGFAVIHAFCWNNSKKGDGVSFGVDYIQKTKAGEALGGTGSAVDVGSVFEAIEDAGDAPVETKSGAGAAGLFS